MKNILQKIGAGWAVAAIMAASFANPALAAGKSAPHANGAYGYTYGGVQRNVAFDAHQTSDTCTNGVDMTGHYVFSLYGTTYQHDINLTQNGATLTGTGGYPAGASTYADTESITGTYNPADNTFTFTSMYSQDSANPGYTYTVNGSVNPNTGVVTVTKWSGGPGADWTVTGTANKVVSGCTGRGAFAYTDANGDHYTMNVKYVSIQGNTAWFAGQVTTGTIGNGWLFVKVVDKGEPGRNHDTSTGDYPLTEQQAAMDVATHAPPSIQDITISSGNIQVH